MDTIRRDIVERLRQTRRCVQFDSAGRMVAFDGEPSNLEREAADEIEKLRRDVERKQQQYERSQRYWVDAAQKALAGDTEHLRLRIDMAQSGPIEMTET